MDTIKCPSCGVDKMKAKVIREFDTKLGGVPFVAKNAKVFECENCGERIFDAKEIKSWEVELKDQLRQKGLIITPQEIKNIRGVLNLNVSDFAKLFGVTRQTVYAWEDDTTTGIQLGPAALLISLLREELENRMAGVYEFLIQLANERGQAIKIKKPGMGHMGASLEADTIGSNDIQLTREISEGAPRFLCIGA